MRKPLLILGVGNYLMGDEGIGVHMADNLRGKTPEGVDVLDGGTAGLQLLDSMQQYETVIMIDATLDSHPAGTIRLIEPRFSKDFPRAMSTHEIGLKDLVEALSLLETVPRMYLFVVSVVDIYELHIGLSEPVSAAMNELERQVLELAQEVLNEKSIREKIY
jgi:hydrogenase maturation protease